MKSQQNDPIYSQISQVKDAVAEVLEHAKKLGATAAEAAMSSTSGLSASTLYLMNIIQRYRRIYKCLKPNQPYVMLSCYQLFWDSFSSLDAEVQKKSSRCRLSCNNIAKR